jgi:DNA-directed RNA polymerase specialized sigma24 family protein
MSALRDVIGSWESFDRTAADVAMQAAKRVWSRFQDYADLEDLESEAFALILSGEDHQQAIANENYGYLQHQLERDLTDQLDTVVRRANKNISYDALLESQQSDEDGGYINPYIVIETASNDYTRESVESLLPAVWDESYAYGMPQRDDAPDPDMPKGSSNKARGNNLSAYIADIKSGWEKTPLTLKERRALLLAYGFGWTHAEIAFNQGISRRGLSQRIETAVGKIVARLNGGYYYDPESEEAVA